MKLIAQKIDMVQQTVGSKTPSCFVSLSKGTALSLIFFGRTRSLPNGMLMNIWCKMNIG
jgi:hypothetical protein